MDCVCQDVANKIISFTPENGVIVLRFINKHWKSILTLKFYLSREVDHKLWYLKTSYQCDLLNNQLYAKIHNKKSRGEQLSDVEKILVCQPHREISIEEKTWFVSIARDSKL